MLEVYKNFKFYKIYKAQLMLVKKRDVKIGKRFYDIYILEAL